MNHSETIKKILSKKGNAAAQELVQRFIELIKKCKIECANRKKSASDKNTTDQMEIDERKYWQALFDLSDHIQQFSYKNRVDDMKVFHYKDLFTLINSI